MVIVFQYEEKAIVGKSENVFQHFLLSPQFLSQLAKGIVLMGWPWIHCVHTLTFISKIFSVAIHWNLIKLHKKDNSIAFFKTSPKDLISIKAVVAMATKLQNFENL